VRIVTVARKPCAEGSTTQNVLAHACGALNIDACRVGSDERSYRGSGVSQMRYSDGRAGLTDGRGRDLEFQVSGRWPANVVLQGHTVAGTLDVQSGTTTSGPLQPVDATNWKSKPFDDGRGWNSHSMHGKGQVAPQGYGDTGGASRYFKQVNS
jgi:site-specific DNA-methyltransferase (adenine-specific)